MIRLVYFARLRDVLGRDREMLACPPEVTTVWELRQWLGARGDSWRVELADNVMLCVAVNQEYVGDEATICEGDEIAFFPPVTGG